ncbi:hypothetical protein DPMN_045063 [Dreissena polymorpha]|uniref:Uncharacterized protein n=1 Tax=Dreissena polymorpha TaxID=45954 RepID=A0A9D4HZA8_DREPO|nr:hypothetical protein DPMN_045063 [Dreissena polymorpha]
MINGCSCARASSATPAVEMRVASTTASKRPVGSAVKKTAPLKSSTGETITDHDQQMRR